jgi:hypothetical protein
MRETEQIVWNQLSVNWFQKVIVNEERIKSFNYYYKNKRGNPCTVVEIDTKASKELRGYMLIEKDIWDCLVILEELLKIIDEETPPKSKVLTKALMRAIAITYGKCFMEAKDRGISLESEIISEKNKCSHKELMGFRNKHVAHSDNDKYENCKFISLLPPEKEVRKEGAAQPESYSELYQVASKRFFSDDCKLLLEELHSTVKDKMTSLNLKIASEMKTIPLKEIYKLPKNKHNRIVLKDKEWKALQAI